MKYLTLTLSLLITCCASPPNAPDSLAETAGAQPPALDDLTTNDELQESIRGAVHTALLYLEEEGTAWMEGRVPIQEGSACVSCHHVGHALWGYEEARRVGIEARRPVFRAMAETAVAFLDRPSVPQAMEAGQVIFGAPHQATSLRPWLLELQGPEGEWYAAGQFPTQRRPIAETDAIATMYGLLALGHADGENAETTSREEALAWLAVQPPGKSTEWLAWRLVLAQFLAERDSIATLRQDLIARQRPDGGWGFESEAASDAFSTGQALYALSFTTDRPLENPEISTVIERAALYLIERQGEDGTWQTESAVVSTEPSAEKDVIYHFWGTAWATLGLARSLEG